MILTAVGLLLLILFYGFSATPRSRTEAELQRMEMRGDPDAWNARQIEETRQARLALLKVVLPFVLVFLVVAVVLEAA